MCALLAERLGSSQYAERVGVDALRSELQPLINARWGDVLRAAVLAPSSAPSSRSPLLCVCSSGFVGGVRGGLGGGLGGGRVFAEEEPGGVYDASASHLSILARLR